MTIAIDFDGVLHRYSKGWQDGSIYDPPMPGALAALRQLLAAGPVFIHTTRNPAQVARWIEQQTGYGIECTTRMVPWLPSWWRWGRRCTFWNDTTALLVTNRKLPATAYIDDRAIRFENWEQTLAAVGITEPDGEQAAPEPYDAEVLETVRRVLGIDTATAPADISGWLLTACRELEKSETARQHLRKEQ